MRAIDTNILVRLITRDDDRQVESAEEFVSKGAWVSHLVLAETSWVLDSVYGLGPKEIAKAMEMLLAHRQLIVQDPDVVESALHKFRNHTRVSFSDVLILQIAEKNGHLPMASFDRELAKLEGVQRL